MINNNSLIITGDFNAQHPLWGSGTEKHNGRIMCEIIDDLDLVILSDGNNTRITPPWQHKSAPDLTLCSPHLVSDNKWQVIQDPGTSDHYPITSSFHLTPGLEGSYKRNEMSFNCTKAD